MIQDKTRSESEPGCGSEEGKALAVMAHDIKAPLSAIVSILGVIEKGYVEDIDKAKELVSRAKKKAETLISMVDDILDYTLLADKSLMKREKVRLFDILKDSIDTMKPYADERNITFIYDPSLCKGKIINGNYTFLLRAFNNIIMNAVKNNKKSGKITIDCSQDKEKHTGTITVSDTGRGIPEEELGKVFHFFERGKQTRRNIDGSLGLGLALVKQIIEDHEGKIELTSTVGVGTTVIVTLPFLLEKKGGTNES